MKAFKTDKKQQERIAAFFKEETSYFPDHVLLKAAGIFLMAVSYMLLIIPVLETEADDRRIIIFGALMFAVGVYTYASKYASYTEPLTKKVMKVAALTKYLPVKRMQLTIFRIKKIVRPCVISAATVIVIRCILSYSLHGSLSLWDVILPLLLMILWPVLTELARY